MQERRAPCVHVVDRDCISTYRYANVAMVASSQYDALCDNSVTNLRQTAGVSSLALVAEGAGAALVTFGALACHSIGLLALCVLGAMLLTPRQSDGYANPLIVMLRIDETVSPDDSVRLVLAQLGGASIAGTVVGLLGIPLRAAPGALGPEALVSACFVATALAATTRAAPAFVAVSASAVLGTTWLGTPAVAIGWAVASVMQGALVDVGAILAAQLLGALAGASIASVRGGSLLPLPIP